MHTPPPKTPVLRAGLPENWLMMRLGHMGDVVLTTGVLNYLGEVANWNFHVLTRPEWAGIFDNHPFVRKVIPFTGETNFRELAHEYKEFGFLDLNANLRSRRLGFLWKGPVARYPKFGLARRLFLLTKSASISRDLLSTNVPQRYALSVMAAAPDRGDLLPRIFLTPEETDTAGSLLAEIAKAAPARVACEKAAGFDTAPGHIKASGRPSPVVALHPYASYAGKTWSADYWRRLADLLDKEGIHWIALGKGAPLFNSRAEDLVNKTGLRETCALLSQCLCLVTGDSGPMHLATATGTPVIGLFGPTTREWGFFPSGPDDIVLEAEHPCRPCSLHGQKTCSRQEFCLSQISPESVLEHVRALIHGK